MHSPPTSEVQRHFHKAVLERLRDGGAWNGSFSAREITFQQLSPYIGKLKSGMVHSLVQQFTNPGDVVCDPFCGSGVVPVEAVLLRRRAVANDLNRYAATLTLGKLCAPVSLTLALERAETLLRYVEKRAKDADLRKVPAWVRQFFHPRTLKEIVAAQMWCSRNQDAFLSACICGILHHQRPGFLSFPASHTVPYLRTNLFPQAEHPDLYEYRDLRSRLVAKIARAYKRAPRSDIWKQREYTVLHRDARSLGLPDASVDAILTSPPYYGALDYARDNRLRLWFLGIDDYRSLEGRLTREGPQYEATMKKCLKEMYRILKPQSHCILVVGEVQRNGKTKDTGAVLGRLALEVTNGGFRVDCVVEDEIPDVRRSRRWLSCTRVEKILILHKTSR